MRVWKSKCGPASVFLWILSSTKKNVKPHGIVVEPPKTEGTWGIFKRIAQPEGVATWSDFYLWKALQRAHLFSSIGTQDCTVTD